MYSNSRFIPSRQIVLRQFRGKVAPHSVGRQEFFSLLLSRRSLERCDDHSTHYCGLFDPRSGDLFAIEESDLHQHDEMTDGLDAALDV